MKKISLLFTALVCASMFAFADPVEEYDVNFALASNGAVASAKSGNNAAEANDGNTGTRWWSDLEGLTEDQKNDQWWQVDLGQSRIFNTIQILWEGAWGKSFDIQISDDGSAWTTVNSIVDQTISGPFPYLQTIKLDAKKTARYVRFQGVKRGTEYAFSFWEFRVLLPSVSKLTSIDLSAAASFAEVGGAGVALTVQAKDQNENAMDAEISYEITPASAGHIESNTFIADKKGLAEIVAYSGEVRSKKITICGYTGSNVALGKEVEASGYDTENNLLPKNAVDDNEVSLWSARTGETGVEREYDAWIIVDLGNFYDISLIAIKWEGACSKHYHVDFSEDKTSWRTAYNTGWDAIATHWEYLYGTGEDDSKVRYVRVWSTEAVSQYGIKIMDLKVFATQWVKIEDSEKPVMTKAQLVSKNAEEAVIEVEATDNIGVKKFHVVDSENGLDVMLVPDEGKITVKGLKHSTTYELTITAIDKVGLESENANIVNFTTDKKGSEYCAKKMSSGDTEAAFLWETDENGAVVITILESLGGADEATHFRNPGIKLENITVGESKEPAANYFTHACEGNRITLSLKDPNNAPAAGTKIHVTNQVIEYTTSKDGNAWPSLTFEYTYGLICLGEPELTKFRLTADSYWGAIGDTIRLAVAASDQLGKPMKADYSYSINPADAGKIENDLFIWAKEGEVTITATSGDKSDSIVVACAMGGNAAEGKEVEAGYNPENQAELAGSANDGDENTAWVTWENRPAEEEWWYVDLGAKYELAGIEVLWGNDYSKEYILQTREEAPEEADKADDSKWVVLDTVRDAKANAVQFTAVQVVARYVRLHSLTRSSAQCIRVREVRVFAYDKEKPVLVKAELATKTWNSAVIRVQATDNFGIKEYRIVEKSLTLDSICMPEDGTIIIEGLKPETEYSFSITAIDNAQYVSEAKTVAVKTDAEPVKPEEGLERIQNSEFRIKKILKDGVLYIERDGAIYTTQGQVVII